MKKLILVNPAFGGTLSGLIGKFFKFGYPPVFAELESMTPGYEIKVYNQPFFVKYEKALVGITSFTSNVYRAYEHANKFKKKGAKVIMGGCHVMFNVKEALRYCDSVIIGEVESIWKQIIEDYENDCLKQIYYGEAVDDFWKYYHEGFLNLSDNKKQNTIQTTRGCKFKCKFCMIPKLYEGNIRHVPIEKVIEEVKSIKGFRKYGLLFNDNNIFANVSYARALFKALIPLKIRWEALCSIDIAKDESLLDLAKKSGCYRLHVGFETINEKVIANNPGKLNMYLDYLELIKRIKKRKIKIRGTFMFGFDEDTYKSLWELFVFTFKANLNLSLFSVLTPFPGTQMYEDYKKEGKIVSFKWYKYNAFNLVTKPKNINSFVLNILVWLFRLSFLITTNVGRLILFLILLSPILHIWV